VCQKRLHMSRRAASPPVHVGPAGSRLQHALRCGAEVGTRYHEVVHRVFEATGQNGKIRYARDYVLTVLEPTKTRTLGGVEFANYIVSIQRVKADAADVQVLASSLVFEINKAAQKNGFHASASGWEAVPYQAEGGPGRITIACQRKAIPSEVADMSWLRRKVRKIIAGAVDYVTLDGGVWPRIEIRYSSTLRLTATWRTTDEKGYNAKVTVANNGEAADPEHVRIAIEKLLLQTGEHVPIRSRPNLKMTLDVTEDVDDDTVNVKSTVYGQEDEGNLDKRETARRLIVQLLIGATNAFEAAGIKVEWTRIERTSTA